MLRDLITSAIQLLRLLVLRAGGLLFLFLANVLISRGFGVDVLGQFQYCLGLVIILGTVGRLGQDQLMLRAAAQAGALGDPHSVTAKLASALAALALPLAVATLALIGWLLVMQPAEPGRVAMQIVMALTILPLGILMVASETMRGARRVEAAIFLQSFLPQALFLAAVYALVHWAGAQSVWLGAAYAAAFAASAMAAFAFWPSLMRPRSGGILRPVKQAWAEGRHFWLAACLNAATAWIDILVLGLIAGATDIGIYAAIIRTGALIGTFIMLVAGPAVPALASHHARGDKTDFAKTYRTYKLIFALSALPFAVLFFGWPSTIMQLWGISGQDATLYFQIYAGFQFLQFFTALPAQITPYVGLERQVVLINAASLGVKAVTIALGYWFFGLLGAVIAAGLSLTVFNLANLYLLKTRRDDQGPAHQRPFSAMPNVLPRPGASS